MLSFVVPRSRWKTVLWVLFLCLLIALRWFGDALFPSGSNGSTQLSCTPTSASQMGALRHCTTMSDSTGAMYRHVQDGCQPTGEESLTRPASNCPVDASTTKVWARHLSGAGPWRKIGTSSTVSSQATRVTVGGFRMSFIV